MVCFVRKIPEIAAHTIKFSGSKKCVDCVYNTQVTYDNTVSHKFINNIITDRCVLYKFKCPITNKYTFAHSGDIRSDEKKCGSEGKYFLEALPNKPRLV